MREILFRGKRTDNGEWVYGCLIDLGKVSNTDKARYGITPSAIPVAETKEVGGCLYFIEPNFTHFNVEIPEVSTETVGQYTGITDNNGTKIFEGDILQHFKIADLRRQVKFENGAFGTEVVFDDGAFVAPLVGAEDEYIVVGNIHDNPELLKGE